MTKQNLKQFITDQVGTVKSVIIINAIDKYVNDLLSDYTDKIVNKVTLERISDSLPGKVFNQDNHGQLNISGNWRGTYVRVNRESITNQLPEFLKTIL